MASSDSSTRWRPCQGRLGSELLRLTRRHRGGQAARRDRRARSPERTARRGEREARLPELEGGLLGPAGGARGQGATKQWCLWASTSTKNPDYRDVFYVEELIGPETVNTMPQETIEAFQDHGRVALTLEEGLEEARKVFEDLAAAGSLRRRGRDARTRRRREVLRLVRGAARRNRYEARRAGRDIVRRPRARRLHLRDWARG